MEWSAKEIFGSLTLFFGVLMICLGLTAQALKNYRDKRCGNPIILPALSWCAFTSRACYAVTISSYYILIPDIVGVTVCSLILGQHYLYRKQQFAELPSKSKLRLMDCQDECPGAAPSP